MINNQQYMLGYSINDIKESENKFRVEGSSRNIIEDRSNFKLSIRKKKGGLPHTSLINKKKVKQFCDDSFSEARNLQVNLGILVNIDSNFEAVCCGQFFEEFIQNSLVYLQSIKVKSEVKENDTLLFIICKIREYTQLDEVDDWFFGYAELLIENLIFVFTNTLNAVLAYESLTIICNIIYHCNTIHLNRMIVAKMTEKSTDIIEAMLHLKSKQILKLYNQVIINTLTNNEAYSDLDYKLLFPDSAILIYIYYYEANSTADIDLLNLIIRVIIESNNLGYQDTTYYELISFFGFVARKMHHPTASSSSENRTIYLNCLEALNCILIKLSSQEAYIKAFNTHVWYLFFPKPSIPEDEDELILHLKITYQLSLGDKEISIYFTNFKCFDYLNIILLNRTDSYPVVNLALSIAINLLNDNQNSKVIDKLLESDLTSTLISAYQQNFFTKRVNIKIII